MDTSNALFYCSNCNADLGPTGQAHLENTEDGGQLWNCEPDQRGKLRMESFDKAHSGRCPGCGMNDNGTHITHRYGIVQRMYSKYSKYYRQGNWQIIWECSFQTSRLKFMPSQVK